jgi:hypothetical protein
MAPVVVAGRLARPVIVRAAWRRASSSRRTGGSSGGGDFSIRPKGAFWRAFVVDHCVCSQARGAGSARTTVMAGGPGRLRNRQTVDLREKIGRYTAEPMMDRRTLLSALFSLGTSQSASICLAAKNPDPRSEVGGLSLSLDQMIGKMIVMGFWGSDPASPGAQQSHYG